MRTKKMVSLPLGKRKDCLAILTLDQDLNQDLDLDLDLDQDLEALARDVHLHSVHSQIDSTLSLMMH